MYIYIIKMVGFSQKKLSTAQNCCQNFSYRLLLFASEKSVSTMERSTHQQDISSTKLYMVEQLGFANLSYDQSSWSRIIILIAINCPFWSSNTIEFIGEPNVSNMNVILASSGCNSCFPLSTLFHSRWAIPQRLSSVISKARNEWQFLLYKATIVYTVKRTSWKSREIQEPLASQSHLSPEGKETSILDTMSGSFPATAINQSEKIIRR